MNGYEKLCKEIGNLMDWSTEHGIISSGSCWEVAYFKMKYTHEKEWRYEYEPFIWHYGSECDFAMDWWEGEQEVELIGVYSLDHLVDSYREVLHNG